MAKVNPEDIRKKVAYIKKQKAELNHRNQIALEKKAAIFKKFPGLLLRPLSLFAAIISLAIYVDSFLEPEFKSYEIHDYVTVNREVTTQAGDVIPSTFYRVYLDESKRLDVLLPESAYMLVRINGQIGIGLTPFLKTPRSIKVNKAIVSEIEFNVTRHRALPLALLILSLMIFFVRPKYGTQGLGFSYASIIMIPGILVVLTLIIVNSTPLEGSYIMETENFIDSDIGHKPG